MINSHHRIIIMFQMPPTSINHRTYNFSQRKKGMDFRKNTAVMLGKLHVLNNAVASVFLSVFTFLHLSIFPTPLMSNSHLIFTVCLQRVNNECNIFGSHCCSFQTWIGFKCTVWCTLMLSLQFLSPFALAGFTGHDYKHVRGCLPSQSIKHKTRSLSLIFFYCRVLTAQTEQAVTEFYRNKTYLAVHVVKRWISKLEQLL